MKSWLVCSDTLAMPMTTERSCCSFSNIWHLLLEAAVSGEIVLTWTLVLTALWPGDSEVQKWWVLPANNKPKLVLPVTVLKW